MAEIQKAGVRKTLPARNEPYWRHLEGNGYVGYRKSLSGAETWQAKWRGRDGKPLQKSLGRVTSENDYEVAAAEARIWFERCQFGAPRPVTVEEACRAYVDAKKLERGDTPETKRSPAKDAETFFKRDIYGKPFGQIELNELTVLDIEKFRNDLLSAGRSKSTVNRLFRVYKAAMRRARKKRLVMSDPWADVDEFVVEDSRRETILTREQVGIMLAAAPDDLSALLRAFLYTGCRPGELAKARVRDFDARTRKLRLVTSKGKTGIARERFVPLDGEQFDFFKEQAKDKLANAYLMTQADGTPWIRHQWSRGVIALRAIKGLPADLVAYNLRATRISQLLTEGIDVGTVAKITGTSIAMIQKHYFAFIPSDVGPKLAAIKIC